VINMEYWLLEGSLAYEVQICLMGCTAVLNNCRPTFQRYVLPPSTGRSP
jgi:hypothetical protein